MKLEDRVALITGGSAGIGKAIAESCAAEGAKIVITGRDKSRLDSAVEELERTGAEVLGLVCDQASSAQVKEAYAKLLDRFGTLDILVNNAGIFRSHPKGVEDRMRFLELVTTPVKKHSLGITRSMSDEEWESMIQIDLNGVFYCTREALNIMEDKGYGRIINIASVAGISSISAFSPNYSAAKGAIVAFTKAVGHEVAGAGVCVNAIAPGYIGTEPFLRGIEKMGPEKAARLMQLVPVGRLGTAQEIASLAVYLASEEAGYMIGQTISPNGGLVI